VTLLDLPIPPKPTGFSPHGAPPGVAGNFTAFKAFRNGEITVDPWWPTRAVIRPRLLLIHTNGASKEGKLPSQVNWANSAPANTHPTYSVNAPQPTKFVPSDREAIGNYRVSKWSLVVETADAGWPTPGHAGDFLYDHAEIVARIVAYESIVADLLGSSMPIGYPGQWDGAGVACHTEPFGYPYWTNSVGKPCPGDTKKATVRNEILPRARQIRAAWLNPAPIPPEVREMPPTILRMKGYANVVLVDHAQAMPLTGELLQIARAQPDVYEVGGNAQANPIPYHAGFHAWLVGELHGALQPSPDGN
jgi:hypothetical protein